MKEIFVDVIGYEGFYQISNFGNVKSLRQNKIMTPGVKDNDYLFVYLSNRGNKKAFYVHRLVAIHFIPNPQNKPDVNHKESNKSDNRCFMLEWCTKSENLYHSFKHGTHKPLNGNRSPAAKLTDQIVLEIKHRYVNKKSYERGGVSIRQLANEYGVHHSVIDGILKGKRWKHIKAA